jgi:hypothetical protein
MEEGDEKRLIDIVMCDYCDSFFPAGCPSVIPEAINQISSLH